MELPHDGEHREHLHCDSRRAPPILPAEGYLSDLLPRAEAVVDGATREAPLPEAVVNVAAEVRLQMWARVPGDFVDGEVCRGLEGRGNTAQAEAAFAVSLQAKATPAGDRCRMFEFLGQCGWPPVVGCVTSTLDHGTRHERGSGEWRRTRPGADRGWRPRVRVPIKRS